MTTETRALPAILTSGSQFDSWLSCQRKRYWSYEALTGVAVCADCGRRVTEDDREYCKDCPCGGRGWVDLRGYERKSMSLPLSTGGWCHKVVQGLFLLHLEELAHYKLRLLAWLMESSSVGNMPQTPADIIAIAKIGYLNDVRQRGLSLGLQLDGFIPEEKFVERTIAEQAALIEAFGWAFVRVRLPRLLAEYEIVDVEREEYTLLSADVGLQARCDAVLRRREDGRLFVYNLKTSHNPNDQRWRESWLTDQQIMTETLAVERRLGERVYGVIIDGFDKGPRVNVWWHNLKEIREGSSKPPSAGDEKWQAQRSRLLYGYRCEDIPGRPTLYDFEGTTRKGWEKFAVWSDEGLAGRMTANMTPVEYWINWLPIEQLEASFVILDPIMRQDEQVQDHVEQLVAGESEIRQKRDLVETASNQRAALNKNFIQHKGYNCGSGGNKCWAYDICWGGVDPRVDDRFVARKANHPSPEGDES